MLSNISVLYSKKRKWLTDIKLWRQHQHMKVVTYFNNEMCWFAGFCRENGFGDGLELPHLFNSKWWQSLWWRPIQPQSGISAWRAEPRCLLTFVQALCRAVLNLYLQTRASLFSATAGLESRFTLVQPYWALHLEISLEMSGPSAIWPQYTLHHKSCSIELLSYGIRVVAHSVYIARQKWKYARLVKYFYLKVLRWGPSKTIRML